MTCQPAKLPGGGSAILCGRQASARDLAMIEAYRDDLRYCSEAGHGHGDDVKCPRCRSSLGLPPLPEAPA